MKKSILNIGKSLNKSELKEINGGDFCDEDTICVASLNDLSPFCIPYTITQTPCGWSCIAPATC